MKYLALFLVCMMLAFVPFAMAEETSTATYETPCPPLTEFLNSKDMPVTHIHDYEDKYEADTDTNTHAKMKSRFDGALEAQKKLKETDAVEIRARAKVTVRGINRNDFKIHKDQLLYEAGFLFLFD